MTLSDVITLGKMGYSKKDVAALQQAEPDADTVNSLEQKIADLNKQISEMQANQQTAAARAPVPTGGSPLPTGGSPLPAAKDPDVQSTNVDDILKNLAGGAENVNPG